MEGGLYLLPMLYMPFPSVDKNLFTSTSSSCNQNLRGRGWIQSQQDQLGMVVHADSGSIKVCLSGGNMAGLLRHRWRGPGIIPNTGPGPLLPGWSSLEVPRSPQHAPWAVSGKKISWQHCTLSCRDHTVATSLGFSVYLKASALKIPYDHKK